jgi:hypothetical protein
MSNKDSPTLREEERRASQSAARARAITESSVRKGKSKDELQAEEERKADTVSRPGGFRNDPDDPTHPDEVRERYLKAQSVNLRPHRPLTRRRPPESGSPSAAIRRHDEARRLWSASRLNTGRAGVDRMRRQAKKISVRPAS